MEIQDITSYLQDMKHISDKLSTQYHTQTSDDFDRELRTHVSNYYGK